MRRKKQKNKIRVPGNLREFKKEKGLLIEISIYVLFLVTTVVKSFNTRDPHSFYYNEALENLFFRLGTTTRPEISKTFDEIVTVNDFWYYVSKNFIPNLYDNNDLRIHHGAGAFVLDENLLLGPPRMRQLRVKPDCEVHDRFKQYFNNCYPHYAPYSEDVDSVYFGKKYKPLASLIAKEIYGYLAFYSGGGYVVQLPVSRKETEEQIAKLRDENWIDEQTRLVILELSLYNDNTKLFQNLEIYAEQPATGGLLMSHDSEVTQLYSIWTTPDNYLMWAVGGCFVFLNFFYSYRQINLILTKGAFRYFSKFWHWIDVINTLFLWICLIYDIWHIWYVNIIIERVGATISSDHLSIDVLAYWNDIRLIAYAICSFIVTVKLLRFLSLNTNLLQFSTTLRRCAKDLLGFSVMFLIIFLAYCELGHLLFGTLHKDFNDFPISFYSMMRLMVGEFNFKAMEESNTVLGPLFFISYTFLIVFILVNIFLAIITETYMSVKSEIKSSEYRFTEYLRLLGKKYLPRICCCLYKDGELRKGLRRKPKQTDKNAQPAEPESLQQPKSEEEEPPLKLDFAKAVDIGKRLKSQDAILKRLMAEFDENAAALHALSDKVDVLVKKIEKQPKPH